MPSGNLSQPSGSPRAKSARPHRNYVACGPEPWMWDAACAGADPELFFPARRGDPEIRAAKRVCARCPVRDECLQYSLRTLEEFGVWGGLDEWERQQLLSKPHSYRAEEIA